MYIVKIAGRNITFFRVFLQFCTVIALEYVCAKTFIHLDIYIVIYTMIILLVSTFSFVDQNFFVRFVGKRIDF